MNQYLLSTYGGVAEAPTSPRTPEDMQSFMERIAALEAEMEASGTFVFGGALHGPDAATVVRFTEGESVMIDGPYIEAKEHIAGFYIINADDLDAALKWARKVVDAINHSIEVRPYEIARLTNCAARRGAASSMSSSPSPQAHDAILMTIWMGVGWCAMTNSG